MQEELMNAILTGLGTILIALIGYVSKEVAQWLKRKGITETVNQKRYLVDIAVHAIEQIYKNEDGDAKLAKAREHIITLMNDNGLDITEQELHDFLEDAVHEMNNGLANGLGMVEVEVDAEAKGEDEHEFAKEPDSKN